VAQVDGGFSSGNWGEPAAWGCSVYYPVISNAGWGLGAWGSAVWGLGDGGLVSASDTVTSIGIFNLLIREEVLGIDDSHQADTLLDCQFNDDVHITEARTVFYSNVIFGTSIVEAVNAADETGGLRYYFGTTIDTANVTDTAATLAIYPVAVIETANVSETVVSVIAIQSTFNETANASDTYVGVGYNFRAIEENAAVVEIVSTLANFAVSIVETSNATDTLTTNTTFKTAVSETATAQDVENRRLLWEPIDTGTVEDWRLINTN
jgi:hypothetical protein